MLSLSYERSTFGIEKPSKSQDTKDSLGIQTFRLRAGYPLMLGKTTILTPGVSYDLIDFPKATSHGLPTHSLHAPMVTLNVAQMLGQHWIISGGVSAGLASDFQERLSMEDVAFNVSAAVIYKFSDSFSLGLGGAYIKQIRQFFPGPVIALNWQPGESFRIRGAVPQSLNVEYRAAPWLTLGIRGGLDMNLFHVSNEAERDAQLSYMTVNVGPKATLNLSDTSHVDLYATASAMRRFEYYVDGDSKRDGYLPSVITFGARLWFGSEGWRSNPSQQQ